MSIETAIERVADKIADSYKAVEKKGGTLPPASDQRIANLPSAIESIPESTGASEYAWWSPKMRSNTDAPTPTLYQPDLQTKSVIPSESIQNVIPDSQYDGLSKVTVDKIPGVYKDTSDATASASDILSGKTAYINGQKVTGTAAGTVESPILQEKTVSPSTSSQSVTPDPSYDGLSKVTVSAATLQTKTVSPSSSPQSITPDSGYYGLSRVTVSAAASPKLQTKSVTPSTSSQSVTPDSSYDGLSKVTVNAIPSTYIDTHNATATASDIVTGKTAYINGSKITGTLDATIITPTINFKVRSGTRRIHLHYLNALGKTYWGSSIMDLTTTFKAFTQDILKGGMILFGYDVSASGEFMPVEITNAGSIDISYVYSGTLLTLQGSKTIKLTETTCVGITFSNNGLVTVIIG